MKEAGLPWSTFSADEVRRDQAAEIHGGLVAYWTDDNIPTAPPRRQVLEETESVFRVEGSDFITIDRTLAEAVAATYDQLDHDEDRHDPRP